MSPRTNRKTRQSFFSSETVNNTLRFYYKVEADILCH